VLVDHAAEEKSDDFGACQVEGSSFGSIFCFLLWSS